MGLLSKLFGSRELQPTSIESAQPGTILVHTENGTVARAYGNNTDDYYHQENAADELCVSGCTSVEIKDATGKVYRYTRESLRRAGWL